MTAVEWLINEIQTKHDKSFIEFYGSEIIQAKEMEKQQIIDACNSNFTYGNNGYPTLGEIYYNETYLSQQQKVR